MESDCTIRFDLRCLERSNSRSPRFESAISRKGTNMGNKLLWNTNRKPYTSMRSPTAPPDLTLSYFERSNSRSERLTYLQDIQISLPRERPELGHMLVLNANRKINMVSPMASSDLTLRDLERSRSRRLRFWRHVSHMGAALGRLLHVVIRNHILTWSPVVQPDWPWVALKGQL